MDICIFLVILAAFLPSMRGSLALGYFKNLGLPIPGHLPFISGELKESAQLEIPTSIDDLSHTLQNGFGNFDLSRQEDVDHSNTDVRPTRRTAYTDVIVQSNPAVVQVYRYNGNVPAPAQEPPNVTQQIVKSA